MTLWQGRFEGAPSPELMALSTSRHFDVALAEEDIAGSRAHVRGLERSGLLTSAEATRILEALEMVAEELRSESFEFAPDDEDIHTAIERRVTEIAGDAGAKLHTGRSRNDQVATDLRLWCKRRLGEVATEVLALAGALGERASELGDAYMPGYTHLQRAQPVLVAHHLLAHGWSLLRDADRLGDSYDRLDVSPLGAGALAGSSLPLDPASVAADLGFASAFENSIDAVSDRDFVAEVLFDLALLAVHVSRLAEEVVIWTSEEVGFLRLDDAYSTGSSMLPQKKNPDVAELARGKSGRLIGNLTGLLATLKGLPLAYNRDLQEDKEPLFDSVGQTLLVLPALRGLVSTASFVVDRMKDAADSPFSAATDVAELLVSAGTPFREAHEQVGRIVRSALEEGVSLESKVREALGDEAASLLGPGVAVTRRTTRGGGGPAAVALQRERFWQRWEQVADAWRERGAAPQAPPPVVQPG